MKDYDATEQAYKNGFKDGVDFIKKKLRKEIGFPNDDGIELFYPDEVMMYKHFIYGYCVGIPSIVMKERLKKYKKESGKNKNGK